LVDQSLHERIYVQATDGAGNTTVSEFVPPGTVCIGIECFKPLPFVILIVVILGAAYIVWRRNKQSSKN
jgi:ABC-type methionine transport system permease subunit